MYTIEGLIDTINGELSRGLYYHFIDDESTEYIEGSHKFIWKSDVDDILFINPNFLKEHILEKITINSSKTLLQLKEFILKYYYYKSVNNFTLMYSKIRVNKNNKAYNIDVAKIPF